MKSEPQQTIPVFIGYDEREHVPFLVTQYTTENSTPTAECFSLNHRDLRKLRLFDRTWVLNELGQYFDERDGKPFSVQFSHSRFLTPFLAKLVSKPGTKYAIFYDCDMVVQEDLQHVIDECEAQGGDKAVYVVQHNYTPKNAIKMDSVLQTQYNKKLWSAFMVFNLQHPDCDKLDPETVSTQTGSWLHQFEWTDAIGSLNEKWQYVAGHSPERIFFVQDAAVIHWTEGGPWFPHMKDIPNGDVWLDAYSRMFSEWMSPDKLLLSGSLEHKLTTTKG
jgi:hypothetical protein